MVLPEIKFDDADIATANATWGCNCGPAAIAASLGKTLDDVRPVVEAEGFSSKRYMNPTMVGNAIRRLGAKIGSSVGNAKFPRLGIARIQWTGPWTAPGANPKWGYHYTHWIATWLMEAGVNPNWFCIFDVNGGLTNQDDWERRIVPDLTRQISRADGRYIVTHRWEVM